MENGTALPERHKAPNTVKDPPEAPMEPDNRKPDSKAPVETSKPSKAKKEKAPKISKPPKGPTPPKVKKESGAKPSTDDHESMFKVGFLSDVYQERPIGPEGISKVITRCKLCCQTFIEIKDRGADELNVLSPPRAQWLPPYRS